MQKTPLILILLLFQILMEACAVEPILDIQIGDFDRFRELWDKQNMLDYQLSIQVFDHAGYSEEAALNIQNGCLVNTDSDVWPEVYPSTVPELFSLIEQIVQRKTDLSKNGAYSRLGLMVIYNEDYYYPEQIHDYASGSKSNTVGDYTFLRWNISLVSVLRH